jgi:hypothetical protein
MLEVEMGREASIKEWGKFSRPGTVLTRGSFGFCFKLFTYYLLGCLATADNLYSSNKKGDRRRWKSLALP